VLSRAYSRHGVGGEQVQHTLLARALARRGHEVSMVVADYGQADAARVDEARARHTLALEKTWKPKLHGTKILELTAGSRYHFNRAASVRYGLYAQRSFGDWTPEVSAEHWFETFLPTSDLRRTRYSLGINWNSSKKWRWTASWAFQKNFSGLGDLQEDFTVLRLGLRYKL
jgi:hypothetical protein